MSLGLPGLLSRLQTAVSKATEQSQKEYYDAGIRVYQAAIHKKHAKRYLKSVFKFLPEYYNNFYLNVQLTASD